MKCPHCSSTLVMTDRQGIEIDYCPDCRGVWLDRGELDKLIERTAAPARPSRRDDDDEDRKRLKYVPYQTKKKKMSSVLGEIFDF